MNLENLDVVELLEKKQAYHLEQLKRIKLALAALKGDVKPNKSSTISQPKIPWTEKVMELLKKSDEGMSLDQIRSGLADEGLSEALDAKNRPTIYSTLSRGLKNGVLEKVGYGIYRKKKRRRTLDRLIENDDNIEDEHNTDNE